MSEFSEVERASIASLLGFTNMGFMPDLTDLPFMIQQSRSEGAEGGIIALAQSYLESDEMADVFRDEARNWDYQLRTGYDWERVCAVWPHLTVFWSAIRNLCETA